MGRRRNAKRIQLIANENARLAALQRGRDQLHQKAEELSTICGSSVAVVTLGPGEAEPTVWPPEASEAAAVVQRYAASESSSRDTMNQKEFLTRRVAKLNKEVKSMKASTDETMAKNLLFDVLSGQKKISDVPVELQGDLMKVVEKRMQDAAATMYLRNL